MKSDIYVAIVLAPKMNIGYPLGGAEVIAEELARGLSSIMKVSVFHGYNDEDNSEHKIQNISNNLKLYSAFKLNLDIQERGIIKASNFDLNILSKLISCDVIISFDRVVSGINFCQQILVLGGIDYDHCRDCITSSEWDLLVVPSKYLARIAIEAYNIKKEYVVVIPNGINDSFFLKKDTNISNNVLLIPGRPDQRKGFLDAIDLVYQCKNNGYDFKLIALKQKSFINTGNFYKEISKYGKKVNLELLPWVPRHQMAEIYRHSAATLCIGSMPEGFGLSAVESIACGTPVFARKIGALANIVPPNHGLFFIEPHNVRLLSSKLLSIIPDLRREAIGYGVKYVLENYTLGTMLSSYTALIEGRVYDNI